MTVREFTAALAGRAGVSYRSARYMLRQFTDTLLDHVVLLGQSVRLPLLGLFTLKAANIGIKQSHLPSCHGVPIIRKGRRRLVFRAAKTVVTRVIRNGLVSIPWGEARAVNGLKGEVMDAKSKKKGHVTVDLPPGTESVTINMKTKPEQTKEQAPSSKRRLLG